MSLRIDIEIVWEGREGGANPNCSSFVNFRLHTEHKPSNLPGSALKVPVVWVVVVVRK